MRQVKSSWQELKCLCTQRSTSLPFLSLSLCLSLLVSIYLRVKCLTSGIVVRFTIKEKFHFVSSFSLGYFYFYAALFYGWLKHLNARRAHFIWLLSTLLNLNKFHLTIFSVVYLDIGSFGWDKRPETLLVRKGNSIA